MGNRTKTYIAGDWSEDQDAVDQLYKWKNGKQWKLTFADAHDLTSARDNSFNCSIKSSLKKRLDITKRFVLIVGNKTADLRSGGCSQCSSYNSYTRSCARGRSIDYRSYVDYECDIAKRDISNIVVLYNSTKVNKSLCPEELKQVGVHIPMVYYKDGEKYWDYWAVKKALEQ